MAVRYVCLVFLCVFLLSACGYSAKSVVTVNSRVEFAEKALEDLVTRLRNNRDGCFSERFSSLLVTKTDAQVDYYISSNVKALDLRLIHRVGEGGLILELNERMETGFSDYAASCYQGLVERLVAEFGRKNISTLEYCKGESCAD